MRINVLNYRSSNVTRECVPLLRVLEFSKCRYNFQWCGFIYLSHASLLRRLPVPAPVDEMQGIVPVPLEPWLSCHIQLQSVGSSLVAVPLFNCADSCPTTKAFRLSLSVTRGFQFWRKPTVMKKERWSSIEKKPFKVGWNIMHRKLKDLIKEAMLNWIKTKLSNICSRMGTMLICKLIEAVEINLNIISKQSTRIVQWTI